VGADETIQVEADAKKIQVEADEKPQMGADAKKIQVGPDEKGSGRWPERGQAGWSRSPRA
jgi:hypothetical protein